MLTSIFGDPIESMPDGRPGTVGGVRARLATAAGRSSARLVRLAGRSGGVIGGRVASRLDPTLLRRMSIGRRVALVSGTNGKSTTTAMLARTVWHLGLAWNSTGANMLDGALSALLDAPHAAIAVLETDESYLPKMIELTDPAIVVLLNLSRDQLDRVAEPAMIAARIGNALRRNGSATVVGNCADPLVVAALSGARRQVWVRPVMAWELDAAVCPSCHEAITHSPEGWRCDRCGARQPQADWILDPSPALVGPGGARVPLELRLPGRANQVNAMFAVAAAGLLGVAPHEAVRQLTGITDVSGRYCRLPRPGGSVRLLLAKNPAGLREVLEVINGAGSTVVISVNSRQADGHDPSWLWDVPFEQLRGRSVVATGERAADLSVRLRYADVPHTVQDDLVTAVRSAPPGDVDLASDYTSFISARSSLISARSGLTRDVRPPGPHPGRPRRHAMNDGCSVVRLAVVYPDLLGTYGDSGNALVLAQRLRWRGIRAEVVPISGDVPDSADLYLLGGGEDAAQVLATSRLRRSVGLRRAVQRGTPILAVCAGLQVLGQRFVGTDGPESGGLGLLDVTTSRLPTRAVGEIVATPESSLLREPLTGFENHRGSTHLGPEAAPLARVRTGIGNGSGDASEGAMQGRVVGTYLHGPVLARNPELADLLLSWAIGAALPPLPVPEVTELRRRLLHRSPGHPVARGTRLFRR